MKSNKASKLIGLRSSLATSSGRSNKLRKVLLPMRRMVETGLITFDARSKEGNTEKRRIDALLIKLPQTIKYAKLLDGYYQKLLLNLGQGKLLFGLLGYLYPPREAEGGGMIVTWCGLQYWIWNFSDNTELSDL